MTTPYLDPADAERVAARIADPPAFQIGEYADGAPINLGGSVRTDITTGGKTNMVEELLATMPPPGPPITDPQQLGGFALFDGLLLSLIGEDGDRVVIIGHHDERTARAAVAAFLRTLDYDEPGEIAADGFREELYGLFTLDPGSTSDNWWCDWTGTEPHPDRIAITLIGIE